MIKIIGLVLVLVVAGVLILAALKPADYTIAREISIQTAPAAIFPHINSARSMSEWMPWAGMDPAMKMSYSGPDEGVGSRTDWDSTGKMGVGSSTIIESISDKLTRFQLEYTKPFQMKQVSEISIRQVGSASVVRWSVSGHSAFPGRVMCLFMNMDKMVGASFEQGLAKLKSTVESAPSAG